MYDNPFAVSSVGHALGRIGDELGFPRPFEQATATVTALTPALPDGITDLTI